MSRLLIGHSGSCLDGGHAPLCFCPYREQMIELCQRFADDVEAGLFVGLCAQCEPEELIRTEVEPSRELWAYAHGARTKHRVFLFGGEKGELWA